MFLIFFRHLSSNNTLNISLFSWFKLFVAGNNQERRHPLEQDPEAQSCDQHLNQIVWLHLSLPRNYCNSSGLMSFEFKLNYSGFPNLNKQIEFLTQILWI